MGGDALRLLPEAALLLGSVGVLLTGSFLSRSRQAVARWGAVAACVVSAAAAVVGPAGPPAAVFSGTDTVDAALGLSRLVIALSTLAVLLLGSGELAGSARQSEISCLLLLSAAGTMVLAGATDLLVLAVAFLLTGIPLYALIGMSRTPAAAEAAVKTYLLGALFGIVLMVGVTLILAMTRGTLYRQIGLVTAGPAVVVAVGAVAVLAGLLFEAGAFPGHFWIPDSAQAALITAAAFLTTVPKVGAMVAAYRLVAALPSAVDLTVMLGVVAAVSMTLGNLAALAQRDPRRLLGWSTVSQVGYLLLPVAVAGRTELALPALLLYLAGYALSNLAAFAVVAAVPERPEISSYRGLAAQRPMLAGALLVALLSLVGTPPTAVFAGKVAVFTAAWDGGQPWLTVVAIVNTLISLFYYLRWIAPAFARPARDESADGRNATERAGSGRRWAAGVAVATAAGTLGLIFLSGWIVLLARSG